MDCYTEAIAFDPTVSVYYTNRAFMLFKKVRHLLLAYDPTGFPTGW